MMEGKLLGHIVSAERVRIDPSRVEAIQTLSLPRSRKEVQAFWGIINFLRRFVSNFAELVKHITTMLKKGNEVKWTVEPREYFVQIKRALTEAPVLISPDYSKGFLIFSFASFDTVAKILLQKRITHCLFQQGIKRCRDQVWNHGETSLCLSESSQIF